MNSKGDIFKKLQWLGIFEDKKIGLSVASPAMILQKLLESKWKLQPLDKDMVVMQHQFEYEIGGKLQRLISSFVTIGENAKHTAMAKTVGLPLGILAKLILEDRIPLSGIQIPVVKEIYIPVLKELDQLGVCFEREIVNL